MIVIHKSCVLEAAYDYTTFICKADHFQIEIYVIFPSNKSNTRNWLNGINKMQQSFDKKISYLYFLLICFIVKLVSFSSFIKS